MNLTCMIVDDEPAALEVLKEFIARAPGVSLADAFTRPLAALEALNKKPAPDVLFADIDMPGLSGLELAALVPESTRVVLTTSFREFGPEAYERNVADYLLKPFGFARFLTCLQKLRAAGSRPDHFFVRTETKGRTQRIDIAEIRFVEGKGNYVQFVMAGQTRIMAYLTLSEVLQELPAGSFSQIHKSFIVNDQQIIVLEPAAVRLAGGELLPVGRAFRGPFYKKISASLLISGRSKNEGGEPENNE